MIVSLIHLLPFSIPSLLTILVLDLLFSIARRNPVQSVWCAHKTTTTIKREYAATTSTTCLWNRCRNAASCSPQLPLHHHDNGNDNTGIEFLRVSICGCGSRTTRSAFRLASFAYQYYDHCHCCGKCFPLFGVVSHLPVWCIMMESIDWIGFSDSFVLVVSFWFFSCLKSPQQQQSHNHNNFSAASSPDAAAPTVSKKEEFRRFLEKTGVLDALTKVLVGLYEEPERPANAVDYVRRYLGPAAATSSSTNSTNNNNHNTLATSLAAAAAATSASTTTTTATPATTTTTTNVDVVGLQRENEELKARLERLKQQLYERNTATAAAAAATSNVNPSTTSNPTNNANNNNNLPSPSYRHQAAKGGGGHSHGHHHHHNHHHHNRHKQQQQTQATKQAASSSSLKTSSRQ